MLKGHLILLFSTTKSCLETWPWVGKKKRFWSQRDLNSKDSWNSPVPWPWTSHFVLQYLALLICNLRVIVILRIIVIFQTCYTQCASTSSHCRSPTSCHSVLCQVPSCQRPPFLVLDKVPDTCYYPASLCPVYFPVVLLTLSFVCLYVWLLEKEMATHSSIFAWESRGQGSLVVYSPWGCKSWTQFSDYTTTTMFDYCLCTFPNIIQAQWGTGLFSF